MIDIDEFLRLKPGAHFYGLQDGQQYALAAIIGRKDVDTFTYTTRRGQRRQRYDKTVFQVENQWENVPIDIDTIEKFWPTYLRFKDQSHWQFLATMIRNLQLGPAIRIHEPYTGTQVHRQDRIYLGETQAIVLQGYFDLHLTGQ